MTIQNTCPGRARHDLSYVRGTSTEGAVITFAIY